MKYRVEQDWHYTVWVTVEAESKKEALELSRDMDGDRVYDDHLYDETVYTVKEAP